MLVEEKIAIRYQYDTNVAPDSVSTIENPEREASFPVSIVVPMYNAQNTIIELLDALLHQDYSQTFEIIFVNDASTDNTIPVLQEFINIHHPPIKISILSIEHSGPAIARNIGAQECKGEIVLFTDADCVPESNWISVIMQRFENPEVDAVAGTLRTKNPESFIARYIGYDIEFRHSQYSEKIDFAGTYTAAFRRAKFMEVMFSPEFTEANAEDNDLSYRFVDRGYSIFYEPEAITNHPHPKTFLKFMKQQIFRASWRVKLVKKNKKHKSDQYAQWNTILQPIIWILAFPSFLLVQFVELNLISSFIFFLVILSIYFILNIRFLLFIYKKEHSLRVLTASFIVILCRSISWTVGGILGIIYQK